MLEDNPVFEVGLNDQRALKSLDSLYVKEGIRRAQYIDYSCAIADDDGRIVATGSSYRNILKCIAVDNDYQGLGLTNKIISNLIDRQISLGNSHYFIYTKLQKKKWDVAHWAIMEIMSKPK